MVHKWNLSVLVFKATFHQRKNPIASLLLCSYGSQRHNSSSSFPITCYLGFKHSGSYPLLVTAQRATRLLPATLAQRQVVASNCLVCADNLPPGVHVFALWEKAGVSGGNDGPRENKLLQTPCRKAIARQLNCQPFRLSQAKTLWD